MILTQQQLHDALVERHGAEIQKKLDGATVGIAGLGGLGSNLAVFLARLGIGHMILVDFDVVDITNLNRQHGGCSLTYFLFPSQQSECARKITGHSQSARPA